MFRPAVLGFWISRSPVVFRWGAMSCVLVCRVLLGSCYVYGFADSLDVVLLLLSVWQSFVHYVW